MDEIRKGEGDKRLTKRLVGLLLRTIHPSRRHSGDRRAAAPRRRLSRRRTAERTGFKDGVRTRLRTSSGGGAVADAGASIDSIPKAFRWLSERYPLISQLIQENRIPEFGWSAISAVEVVPRNIMLTIAVFRYCGC